MIQMIQQQSSIIFFILQGDKFRLSKRVTQLSFIFLFCILISHQTFSAVTDKDSVSLIAPKNKIDDLIKPAFDPLNKQYSKRISNCLIQYYMEKLLQYEAMKPFTKENGELAVPISQIKSASNRIALGFYSDLLSGYWSSYKDREMSWGETSVTVIQEKLPQFRHDGDLSKVLLPIIGSQIYVIEKSEGVDKSTCEIKNAAEITTFLILNGRITNDLTTNSWPEEEKSKEQAILSIGVADRKEYNAELSRSSAQTKRMPLQYKLHLNRMVWYPYKGLLIPAREVVISSQKNDLGDYQVIIGQQHNILRIRNLTRSIGGNRVSTPLEIASAESFTLKDLMQSANSALKVSQQKKSLKLANLSNDPLKNANISQTSNQSQNAVTDTFQLAQLNIASLQHLMCQDKRWLANQQSCQSGGQPEIEIVSVLKQSRLAAFRPAAKQIVLGTTTGAASFNTLNSQLLQTMSSSQINLNNKANKNNIFTGNQELLRHELGHLILYLRQPGIASVEGAVIHESFADWVVSYQGRQQCDTVKQQYENEDDNLAYWNGLTSEIKQQVKQKLEQLSQQVDELQLISSKFPDIASKLKAIDQQYQSMLSQYQTEGKITWAPYYWRLNYQIKEDKDFAKGQMLPHQSSSLLTSALWRIVDKIEGGEGADIVHNALMEAITVLPTSSLNPYQPTIAILTKNVIEALSNEQERVVAQNIFYQYGFTDKLVSDQSSEPYVSQEFLETAAMMNHLQVWLAWRKDLVKQLNISMPAQLKGRSLKIKAKKDSWLNSADALMVMGFLESQPGRHWLLADQDIDNSVPMNWTAERQFIDPYWSVWTRSNEGYRWLENNLKAPWLVFFRSFYKQLNNATVKIDNIPLKQLTVAFNNAWKHLKETATKHHSYDIRWQWATSDVSKLTYYKKFEELALLVRYVDLSKKHNPNNKQILDTVWHVKFSKWNVEYKRKVTPQPKGTEPPNKISYHPLLTLPWNNHYLIWQKGYVIVSNLADCYRQEGCQLDAVAQVNLMHEQHNLSISAWSQQITFQNIQKQLKQQENKDGLFFDKIKPLYARPMIVKFNHNDFEKQGFIKKINSLVNSESTSETFEQAYNQIQKQGLHDYFELISTLSNHHQSGEKQNKDNTESIFAYPRFNRIMIDKLTNIDFSSLLQVEAQMQGIKDIAYSGFGFVQLYRQSQQLYQQQSMNSEDGLLLPDFSLVDTNNNGFDYLVNVNSST
ncbi:MAG: hypothetical protein HON94_12035, partial [Methylococcales bacterium]|nr:hypothetical protein [Methylococcales bacterium]